MTTSHRFLVPLIALTVLAALAGQAEAVPCPTCPPNTQCDPTDGQCKPLCNPWCISASGDATQNRECGPDGCGGSCGECDFGQTCTSAGHCEGECAPQCLNKECGDDGCGGQCGWCIDPAKPYCTNNLCVDAGSCVSDCDMVSDEGFIVPKQCGDDG